MDSQAPVQLSALARSVYRPPRARAAWTLAEVYAPSVLRHYGHGRNALCAALELAGAAGRRVLLPGFICRDVLSALCAAGAEPVFYPVGRDLAPSSPPESWPQAAVAVAVDYFGVPQDLAPFEAYARLHGAALVEDAAHALFSRDSGGRLLGTRVPLGVLSPRKSLALPNGGCLVVTGGAAVPDQVPYAGAPGVRYTLKSLARPALAAAGARAALSALGAFRGLKGEAAADPAAEHDLPDDAPCPELARPIAVADPAEEARRRLGLWDASLARARAAGLRPVFERLPPGAVPYAFAMRGGLAAARRAFQETGLTVLTWPDLPATVAPQAPAHYKDLLLAHFLW
ncbi:MAG: DegT/DnrJ/EryC1/StrS family aminotransferase [Elusimicrobia bacterium]|nr:DegT/DnrJ/EryC1/StrS family aminotransferase [Elusimicrobiota bacterium]